MRMLIGLAASAAACVTVAACANVGPPVPIASVPTPAPRIIPAGAEAKPIQFRRVVVRLNRGTRIGTISGGYLCIPAGDLTWKGGRVIINDDEFTTVFREELVKANYPVVGDPNALFEDASEWRAELLVAGLVTEMQLNVCTPPGNTAKGEAGLTVEWQIFSRLDRKVVHKVTTKGTGRLADFTPDGTNTVLHMAFAQATRALIADEGFYKLVSSQGPIGASPDIREADFRLSPRAPQSGAITTRMAEVQGAVVTVFAGPGQGSGFFISSDGYVLTNAHVVRDAKFVKLKLTTGREILGEVVATNTARDVGLIKTQEAGFAPLAIGLGELPIGNDVYAIGSPFTERLASTVTRGIISAYRSEDGMRLIQSDVSVQPGNSGGPLTDASGNVVGITMKGVAVRGAMTGLNFFIPIEDALRSVGIERGEAARGASRMARIDRPAAPRPAPPPQVASAATPQVAALPPAPPKIDGDYRATIPANTLSGVGPFDVYISIRSGIVSGYAQPSSSRGNFLCRVSGSVATDGDALIDIACSSGGFTQSNIRATGTFEPEPGTTDVVGRTRYSFASGATGELVWQR